MFPLIWNFGPSLGTLGFLNFRMYSILFASSFVVSRILADYMFKKDTKYKMDQDRVLLYLILATTIGARVGHVVFYDWEYYSQHLLEIILPFRFSPSFKVVGFSGLASHGAAIGILLAGYLYTNWNISIHRFMLKFEKKTTGPTFLWFFDRIVIFVAIAGCFIRIGNFMNSEIYGVPTDSNLGVVFVRDTVLNIRDCSSSIDDVSVNKLDLQKNGVLQPIEISIKFSKFVKNKDEIALLIDGSIKDILQSNQRGVVDHIYQPYERAIDYKIIKEAGQYVAVINTCGIVRHPSQLYEAIGCAILFVVLFLMWVKRRNKMNDGNMFAIFLVYIFGLRIIYEMFKPGKLAFELLNIKVTKPQLLSIPAVLIGLAILIINALKKKNTNN